MKAKVVVISDGKRGHENQSRVIAKMLGNHNPLVMLLKPGVQNGGWQELLVRLKFRFGGRNRFSRDQAATLVKAYLQPEDKLAFRDFAIANKQESDSAQVFTVSSGTPPATFNLVMAAMLGCKAIVNMRPSLLPLELFDLAILPESDASGGSVSSNVVTSLLTPGFFDEKATIPLFHKLKKDFKLGAREYWGVAIGEEPEPGFWDGGWGPGDLHELVHLAKNRGSQLLVTTSFGTTKSCRNWLEETYRSTEQIAYLHIAQGNQRSPLPAFYQLCSRMFVSGESLDLVSGAIHAGHNPVVMPMLHYAPEGDIGWAFSKLESKGLAACGGETIELPPGISKFQRWLNPPKRYYTDELADKISKMPSVRREPNIFYNELKEKVRGWKWV